MLHTGGGRGRCEPLRCILAAAGVSFEQVFFTEATGKAELAKLRAAGVLTYDQVPLVEIDGLRLVQGTAPANYLGMRLGLLPDDPKDSYCAQREYVASQDARGPLLSYPFAEFPEAPSEQATASRLAERMGPKGLLSRYAPRWEAMLLASGGPFLLGAKPSIADVGVFECCDYFSDVSSPNPCRGRTPALFAGGRASRE